MVEGDGVAVRRAGPAGRELVLVVCQDALTRPTLGEQRIADVAARIQELLARERP